MTQWNDLFAQPSSGSGKRFCHKTSYLQRTKHARAHARPGKLFLTLSYFQVNRLYLGRNIQQSYSLILTGCHVRSSP